MSGDDRFQRISEVFEQARGLTPSARDDFIAKACNNDSELLAEVQALLAHHDEESGLLDQPVASPTVLHSAAEEVLVPTPDRIGKYAILRRLGSGGMGIVYLAKQEHPAREVAIKVMRPGALTGEMQKRFELETTLLGRLQHPSVAQIYEAGIDDEGGVRRPFFAMEYVEGLPLDVYVRQKAPSVRQRLDLFTQICDAVHHAHQKGVIHRDLKPSNIVVVPATSSEGDSSTTGARPAGRPAIKILDFGVARVTDSDLQVTSLHTDLGQLVGTLPYMSPEQIGGHAHEVDTRSDVYALGVILYEVLAGKLPYDLKENAIVKAAQIITEQDPIPLSTISNIYRGDLNTIALKALEKEPERRYASACDLAADVQRYLDNQPIVARRGSAMYQLRKFASRNKGLVAGMVAAFVMLVAGVITSSLFALGQTRALRESEEQRAVAEAVVNFLSRDLLAQANPYTSGEKDMTVRTVVDKAAATVGQRFQDQPQVELAIRHSLGRTYLGLGDYDQANEHLARAIALYETHEGVDKRLLEMRGTLVQTHLDQWKLDDAETMAAASLALARKHLGPQHPETARLLSSYAVVLKRRGRFPEAEKHYREALDILKGHGMEYERLRIIVTQNLALVVRDQKRYEEAEALLREAIDAWGKLHGEMRLDATFTMVSLGDVLWNQATKSNVEPGVAKKKLDEAELWFRESLAIRREKLGEEHADTANSIYAIGLIYGDRGDHAESERLQRKALAIRRRVFGSDENAFVLDSMNAVATSLRRQGRYDEALEISRTATETAERAFGAKHYKSRRYRRALYAALWNLGDVAAIEALNEQYGVSLPETEQAWGLHALAEAHAMNDELELAIRFQREALKVLPNDSSLREPWQSRLDELIAQQTSVN